MVVGLTTYAIGTYELAHIRCKSNHHIYWTMATATVTYHRICNKMGATSGAGTAYRSGAPVICPPTLCRRGIKRTKEQTTIYKTLHRKLMIK
jgi:hypothetical protein